MLTTKYQKTKNRMVVLMTMNKRKGIDLYKLSLAFS